MNETINDVLRKDYDLCVKDLKKSEKKREKIEKKNQRLNNVLNEIKKIVDNYYTYDYEDENLERLNVIDKINRIIKESDK